MTKEILRFLAIGVLIAFFLAEPQVNAEEFDINSISSFLGDDATASSAVNGKTAGFSFNYNPSTPNVYKAAASTYSAVQKEPAPVPAYNSPYNPSYSAPNQPYQGQQYHGVESYNVGSFGSESQSTPFSFPTQGAQTKPSYGGASSHSSSTHGPNPPASPLGHVHSGNPPANLGQAHQVSHRPQTFGPSAADAYKSYSHYSNGGASYNALHPGSTPGSYSPYTFEKPSRPSYQGPSPYSSYSGQYSGPQYSGGFSSSSPTQFGYGPPKTPYSSPYKPTGYYNRPYSGFSNYKPHSYSSSRYPGYSGKYSTSSFSRPGGYSNSAFSSKPYSYKGPYKGVSSKPVAAYSFSDLF